MAIVHKTTGEVKFAGAVLSIKRRTFQIMSDVWEDGWEATVWNAETNSIHGIPMWDYSVDASKVDVTPEVIEAIKTKYRAMHVASIRAGIIEDSVKVAKDKIVRVAKGRTAKGTVGRVFHVMSANYGMGYHSQTLPKAGIALNEETHTVEKNGRTFEAVKNAVWVWAHNLEVLNPEQYQDFSSVEEQADLALESTMKRLEL